jgi:hypothetical protein
MRKIVLRNIQALNQSYQSSNPFFLITNQSLQVSSNEECPLCHYAMDLESNAWRNYHDADTLDQQYFNVFSLYTCPHCHGGFVIVHTMQGVADNSEEFDISEVQQIACPSTAVDKNVDARIREISPRFCEVYNQCYIAKQNNLSELYGMGLRKALEILVTDYVLTRNPGDKSKIIKIPLHSRIENYFKDSDARTSLLACKYLGNNETHYDNSNSAEDTALLGNLIDDVIYYIERELRGEQAATIIQKN